MSKHQFTAAETYAVWKHHGAACYLCEEPLGLQEATVDHFIPEHLEEKPEEFQEVRRLFDLDEHFLINDFCNWLPCHVRCNQQKGSVPLRATFKAMATVEKLVRDAEKVKKIEQRIRANRRKDEILAKIMVAVEGDIISKEEILGALVAPELPDDEDIQVLRSEISLRVNPNQWHIVQLDEDRELAMVSNGRLAGSTPIGQNPHHSWECPVCGNYGPWNGARCLSCGNLSDPFD